MSGKSSRSRSKTLYSASSNKESTSTAEDHSEEGVSKRSRKSTLSSASLPSSTLPEESTSGNLQRSPVVPQASSSGHSSVDEDEEEKEEGNAQSSEAQRELDEIFGSSDDGSEDRESQIRRLFEDSDKDNYFSEEWIIILLKRKLISILQLLVLAIAMDIAILSGSNLILFCFEVKINCDPPIGFGTQWPVHICKDYFTLQMDFRIYFWAWLEAIRICPRLRQLGVFNVSRRFHSRSQTFYATGCLRRSVRVFRE